MHRGLLRCPSVTGDFAAAGWRAPEVGLLGRQHGAFGQLLTDLGCEVKVVLAAGRLIAATYVRNPGLLTGAGAVLFQMVKPTRVAEPALLGAALTAAGASDSGAQLHEMRAPGTVDDEPGIGGLGLTSPSLAPAVRRAAVLGAPG